MSDGRWEYDMQRDLWVKRYPDGSTYELPGIWWHISDFDRPCAPEMKP